jgi:hypothetical protein
METMSAAEYRAYMSVSGTERPPAAKRASPEEDLQRICVEYVEALSRKYPILEYLFHPANGGKRPKGEAGKMKALGVKTGVPDLMLPFPSPNRKWQGLALELKSPEGKMTEDQRRWLNAAIDGGWLAGLVWDFQDFQTYLDIFLGRN